MKLNKKGVTIFEAVLAMIVITAVSVSAIIVISNFSRISGSMTSANASMTVAENALECFKVAKTFEEFRSLVNTASTKMFTAETWETGNAKRGSFETSDSNYTVKITVIYPSSGTGEAVFSAEVLNTRGYRIFSVNEYKKAV